MKKAIATFGLLTLVMILTSFTAPQTVSSSDSNPVYGKRILSQDYTAPVYGKRILSQDYTAPVYGKRILSQD